jgi:hypothetical protein
MAPRLPFMVDDGGRAAAGFKGRTGDCVARSVAIASGQPYADVYAALAAGTGAQRVGRNGKRKGATAARGINTTRQWFKDYMRRLGFRWVATMQIGSGCTVHLAPGELPHGRLVVAVSKHYTAVIDGVIRDTHDPQRDPVTTYAGNPVQLPDGTFGNPVLSVSGGRCVYGYWVLEGGGR